VLNEAAHDPIHQVDALGAASSLCSNRSTRESFLPKFSLSIPVTANEERPSKHQPGTSAKRRRTVHTRRRWRV
jgi:hypothetical protein